MTEATGNEPAGERAFVPKSPAEVAAELGGQDEPERRSQPQLPIREQLDDRRLTNLRTQAATAHVMGEYVSAGMATHLGRIEKGDMEEFEEGRDDFHLLNPNPIYGEDGKTVIAYDMYLANPDVMKNNPEEAARIKAVSDELSLRIPRGVEADKVRILEAEVAAGRAQDVGVLSDEEYDVWRMGVTPKQLSKKVIRIMQYSGDIEENPHPDVRRQRVFLLL